MFIHDRHQEFDWKLRQIETNPSGDLSDKGPGIGLVTADIDPEGNWTGRRSWDIGGGAARGIRRFGVTVRDNWIPFGAGTGGATLAVTGLQQGFDQLAVVPGVVQAIIGGLVGWKSGELANKVTVKAIEQISIRCKAITDRYYIRLRY